MTTEAAQLQFAAEFTLFIAAIAAIAVTALRPELFTRRVLGRILLVVGSAALAGAAFLHGSLLVDDGAAPVLMALRLGGIAAVAAAVAAWQVPRGGQGAAAAGVLALAGAEGLVAADLEGVADGARGAGAVLFGIGLVLASRRAIAARVAMAAATGVLLVVTVLSIALSVVIAENVEDEVARRYEARADTESQVFTDTSGSARRAAELLALVLPAERRSRSARPPTPGSRRPTPRRPGPAWPRPWTRSAPGSCSSSSRDRWRWSARTAGSPARSTCRVRSRSHCSVTTSSRRCCALHPTGRPTPSPSSAPRRSPSLRRRSVPRTAWGSSASPSSPPDSTTSSSPRGWPTPPRSSRRSAWRSPIAPASTPGPVAWRACRRRSSSPVTCCGRGSGGPRSTATGSWWPSRSWTRPRRRRWRSPSRCRRRASTPPVRTCSGCSSWCPSVPPPWRWSSPATPGTGSVPV